MVLAALMLYGTYRGYRIGLILVIVNSIALLLAAALAFFFLDEMQKILSEYLNPGSWFLPLLAFAAVFFLVFFGLGWFASFASRAIGRSLLSPVNQAGGALFGLFRMAFLIGSVVFGLSLMGIRPEEKIKGELWLLPLLRDTGVQTMGILAPLLPFLRDIAEKR